MTVSLVVFAESPAPLAGMAYPPPDLDWRSLETRGFALVVRLHPGDYDPSPLRVHDVTLQDLYGGASPADPAGERKRVREAARAAADSVADGNGVIVHCLGGTGRTGTVAGCALRLLGRTADQAIATVQSQLPRWPESPWQLDVVRSG